MFGRKCSLCGGKLDSRSVCKECGLDNTKSDKYYKINQSRCDHMPLTHVHEEEKTSEKTFRKKSVKYTYQPTEATKKQKTSKGKIGVFVSVLSVLFAMIPVLIGIFGNVIDTSYTAEPELYTDVAYNPYEYLEKEHPVEGDYYTCTLKAGEYIVGVHIAEGDYFATTFDDYDTVEVVDNENGIFLYEYPAKEGGNYLDDLRLFNGAVVTITSMEGVRLTTDNAQFETQVNAIGNPVKDSYELKSEYEAEAGVDFEAGVYDIIVADEFAYIHLTIYDENGEEWVYRSYDMGKEGYCGSRYNNLVIPEGAVILCEGCSTTLIPSEVISSTDYMGYYY